MRRTASLPVALVLTLALTTTASAVARAQETGSPSGQPPSKRDRRSLAQIAQRLYENPLRLTRHLHAMRIDEGVDYRGAGPVKSLGAGIITGMARRTSHFWAHVDGNVVVERMLEGPLQGISVYMAENCIPNPNLGIGQRVTADTTLCRLRNRFPWLEIGFAREDGSGVPAAWSVYKKVPDGSKTAYGVDFSHLMGDLGAPEGNTNARPGDVSYHPWKRVGKLPPDFPRF